MMKEMGISREAMLSQNRLNHPIYSVIDSSGDDGPMYPIDPIPPKQALVDLLGSEPFYPIDASTGKGSGVPIGLGPANPDENIDAPHLLGVWTSHDPAPIVQVTPNPTVPNGLVFSPASTPIDPVQRITSLLDLFESHFAQPVLETKAVPSQQGGYIFVPTGGTTSAGPSSNLLVWLAVLGIIATVGFYFYERRKRK